MPLTGPASVTVWVSEDAPGDVLLRRAAGDLLATRPSYVDLRRECPGCARPDDPPHGRPVLPGTGVFASVSRSQGLVVVALSRDGAVGVDVERGDASGLAGTILGVGEQPGHRAGEEAGGAGGLLVTWCRKEAVLKATGDGLRVDPRLVRVSGPTEAPALLDHRGEALDAVLADLDLDGTTGAVAVLGVHTGLTVTLRRPGPLGRPAL